jgi:putrescine aminotransferase
MDRTYDNAITYSRRWLDIIHQETLSTTQAQAIIAETRDNFAKHFNAGFLEYRKSVTEAGDWTAVEWNGRGAIFWDALGREYIDCLGGYGLLSLGWSHPRVVDAVRAQLERTPMPSQELLDPLRGVLARLLAEITPGDIQYCFFVASGTETIEGAMKLAKMATGRPGFIAALGGFHGKTSGSLSLMGKSVFRGPALPLYPWVRHVPYGDADAVEQQLATARAVGEGIAAVVMEPIQGEAGAIVPPDDFWPRLRQICDAYDVLLIADEVQTGLGRTGALWGVDHWHVVPDIMCLAKSLGGGVMPVGAFCGNARVWQIMMEPNPFIHTTTTGGGPLACAAALATINVVLEERLWEQAAEKGAYLKGQVERLVQQYPAIYDKVTGKGLLLGQHFHDDQVGYKVAAGLFRRGVLVAGTLNNARVIRLEPPLVITQPQIDAVLDRLADTLAEVNKTIGNG